MVNITIDGKKLEVPAGITVLEAARQAGIEIPTLCDHPKLTPYGGCRLCVVEVEGAKTLQTSCTLPVGNNMVVKTNTEKVKEARKFVLTMLFSERNHFCPYCVVNDGDCELQMAAYDEGMTHWPLQPNWQPYPVDASHPYFILDHNRCILCRRCVRACAELVGNFTLGTEERGANSFIVADLGTPLGESSCISCGNCVQDCPTGALIDRWSAYQGQCKDVEITASVCTGCSLGCGINILTRDNRLVRIEGNWDAPVNEGLLCKTGRFLPMDEQRERILTPMVKVDGKLKASTWENALDILSKQFRPLIAKKDDGIAAIVSTRLSAESLFLTKEVFSNKMGSNMVTTLDEGISTLVSTHFAEELGASFEGKLDLIDQSDCMVIFDDLVNKDEVMGFFVKRNASKGAKLIVIDTEDNSLSQIANYSLKPNKGNLVDLIKGIAAILAENFDKNSIQKTGVALEELKKIAGEIKSAQKLVFVYGKSISDDTLMKALYGLAKASGAIREGYNGFLSAKGKANSMAASIYGLDKPFHVNGQRVVFVSMADEEPSQRLIQSLAKVPFLVVQSSYASQLTAMAHVVLPAENWSEQEGHFVNAEGRIQKQNRALQAPEEVKSISETIKQIAGKIGLDISEDAWKQELTARSAAVKVFES